MHAGERAARIYPVVVLVVLVVACLVIPGLLFMNLAGKFVVAYESVLVSGAQERACGSDELV